MRVLGRREVVVSDYITQKRRLLEGLPFFQYVPSRADLWLKGTSLAGIGQNFYRRRVSEYFRVFVSMLRILLFEVPQNPSLKVIQFRGVFRSY